MKKGFFLLALLYVLPLLAEVPKLVVRGEAFLKKAADQAILSIGVVTEAPNAHDAVEANNKKMNSVIGTLKGFGLEKGDFETGQFQVVPQYTQRPKQASEDWKPKIVGYQATNSLKVKTSMLEQLGDILDAAIGAGANSVGDIQFTLKEPRDHRKEAIRNATQNAMQDARTLAEAAGVKLQRILLISLDQTEIRPFFKAAMMSEPVPIEAGHVDVNASINLTYEIGS